MSHRIQHPDTNEFFPGNVVRISKKRRRHTENFDAQKALSEIGFTLTGSSLVRPNSSDQFPFVSGTADEGRCPQLIAEISRSFLKFGTTTTSIRTHHSLWLGGEDCAIEQNYLDTMSAVLAEEQSRGTVKDQFTGTKPNLDYYEDNTGDDRGENFPASGMVKARRKWQQTLTACPKTPTVNGARCNIRRLFI